MSFTNRPVYTRMMDAAFFSLMAGMGLVSFLVGQASNQPTCGKVDVGTLAAAIPFGTLISFYSGLAIGSIFNPYWVCTNLDRSLGVLLQLGFRGSYLGYTNPCSLLAGIWLVGSSLHPLVHTSIA